MNAIPFDWQLVAVTACVIWAMVVIVRRMTTLFSKSPSSDCGSSGCSACPSKGGQREPEDNAGFVSLQSLELSSQSVHDAGLPR